MQDDASALPLAAIVVGSGPAALGASLALSGYRPHIAAGCSADTALAAMLPPAGSSLLEAPLPELASGLRGRSHNPLALLFDALHQPGADGPHPRPSCLVLRRSGRPLPHRVISTDRWGGSWHSMHNATLALSPGAWMDFPSFRLDNFIAASTADPSATSRARPERSTLAAYYEAAAIYFGLSEHLLRERLHSAERTDRGWVARTASGKELHAPRLILAVGTSGAPATLGVPGEELPFVRHRCSGDVINGREQESREGAVLVVGAGLAAADCVVRALRAGRHVAHVFRGTAATTRVVSKFGATHAAAYYPEYFALSNAMRGEARAALALAASADASYEPFPERSLAEVLPNSECHLRPHGEALDHSALNVTVRCSGVLVLIGASPDFSFLSPAVRRAIESEPPPLEEQRRATHPVHVHVDPFSMEARAVPGLHALGPLRGDNFVRFAWADGFGVVKAIEGAGAQGEGEDIEAGSPAISELTSTAVGRGDDSCPSKQAVPVLSEQVLYNRAV